MSITIAQALVLFIFVFLLLSSYFLIPQGDVTNEETPGCPGEHKYNPQDPALGNVERKRQRERVGIVLHDNQELCGSNSSNQPGLLTQLLMELPLSIKLLNEFPEGKGQEGFSCGVSWEPPIQPALPQQLLSRYAGKMGADDLCLDDMKCMKESKSSCKNLYRAGIR